MLRQGFAAADAAEGSDRVQSVTNLAAVGVRYGPPKPWPGVKYNKKPKAAITAAK
jgi:hypothetical protein